MTEGAILLRSWMLDRVDSGWGTYIRIAVWNEVAIGEEVEIIHRGG